MSSITRRQFTLAALTQQGQRGGDNERDGDRKSHDLPPSGTRCL